MRGKFIVLEGIDGCGKSTQTGLLSKHLRYSGIPCEVIHYPDYSGRIGNLIREWLHSGFDVQAESLFLLYAADMMKDQARIREMLAQGKIVVLDRYITSAMAYQSVQGIPMERIRGFCRIFGFARPDAVIYLDVSPETAVRRKTEEKGKTDRNESRRFLESVRSRYQEIARENLLGPWFVVDGEKEPEKVFDAVKRILKL